LATRAIVPNANGEGSIGRPLLRWGDIQTNKINNLDFPSSIEPGSAMKALVVNDDNTGFVIGNAIGIGGGGNTGGYLVLDNDQDLTPLPFGAEYVQPMLEDIQEGDNGRIIVINEEEDAFVILRQPIPIIKIEEGDAGKVLAVKSDESGYEHSKVIKVSDIQAGDAKKIIAINNNETGYEFIEHLKYNSIKEAGSFYPGEIAPDATNRLNYDGYFYATKVYNAVYNDYAECFDSNYKYENVKYKIVEIQNGKAVPAQELSNAVTGIVSTTYGFLLYGSEEDIQNNKKIPIGMSGTLLVDSEKIVEDQDLYKFVCTGIDSKARVIPFGEAYKYENKIVGKVINIHKETNQYSVIICLR
jgi:hypothetical protein